MGMQPLRSGDEPLPKMAAMPVARRQTMDAQMPGDPADMPEIDVASLTALLNLAGPEFAEELASRLLGDLSSVAANLSLPDRDLLRAQSHNLIALAGTIGAKAIGEAAQRLNNLTHHGQDIELVAEAAALRPNLEELLRRLEAWLKAARGAA